MNNITIIGCGYVGLVTGACLSEFGMNVICVDKDSERIMKINAGELPIYEPGLKELVTKGIENERLMFTEDMNYAVNSSDTIFITVGTPQNHDGSADTEYVLDVSSKIAACMSDYKLIVDKSTVPVGTAQAVKETVKKVLIQKRKKINFDVASNPEFLREGSAIRDFMHPDRIVIGVENKKAENILKNIYNVLYLINRPFIVTNFETAELIKYVSNAFLATKISFINETANFCEKVGADVHKISTALGMDGRISKYFLHPGPGYGGSCFPKDTKALLKMGERYGSEFGIIESVIKANEKQAYKMISKIEDTCGNINGMPLTVWGLSFKPETDDIRESPAIVIVKELYRKGAILKLYDPKAMDNTKSELTDLSLEFYDNQYNACINSDALIIATDWNQFRHIDFNKVRKLLTQRYIFDLRNIYEPDYVRNMGFHYIGVGRN